MELKHSWPWLPSMHGCLVGCGRMAPEYGQEMEESPGHRGGGSTETGRRGEALLTAASSLPGSGLA